MPGKAFLDSNILIYAHYDSQIIAAALAAGCTVLYSEDMQHGQLIDGTLSIVNPFAA
jgi:predicted nucleic acid-binding protein